MDPSKSLSALDIYGELYLIEIIIGILMREHRKMTISIVSYAISLQQSEALLNMSSITATGNITEKRCNQILAQSEKYIVNTNKPIYTLAGRTMELLLPFIGKEAQNTVITFSGAPSYSNAAITRIRNAIQKMKSEVGPNMVNFFAAGFTAKNRSEHYKGEVRALAEGRSTHEVLTHNKMELLIKLGNILYEQGILSREQSKAFMMF